MKTSHHEHNLQVHHDSNANSHHDKLNSSNFKLALSATLHCLMGCGIGEILGMIISTALGFNNLTSITISVILGFIAGLLLGILPLKKFGFSPAKALKTVIIGEGISILVMETFEVLAEVMIPGVMSAHLTDPIFWIGMAVALLAGFWAALPVNYIMVKKGMRHIH